MTVELLMSYCITLFSAGFIYGAAYAWNRKVFFFLVFLPILCLVVKGILVGLDISPDNFPVWYYVPSIISFLIGSSFGEKFYEHTFDK